MKNYERLLKINLRLFEGEGGPAAGGDAGATAEQGTASLGKKQKGEKVVYGVTDDPAPTEPAAKEPPVAEGTQPNTDPEARKAEFERMMHEYKDLFTEKTQEIINKRFKETKTLEKQLGDTKPILDTLMAKYGITDGDVTKLTQAIEADDAYWEELADKEGLTVEQYKMKQRLEAENAKLRQMQESIAAQQKTQQIYSQWMQEAEQIKGQYPDFNLETELANPDFVRLIGSGQIDLRTAYEVLHINDIKTGVAKQAQANVANTIRATGQRPSENGTASQSGVIVKSDVSKLSRQDREEVARRVARGEKIKF